MSLGRPLQYNPDTALCNAMNVFWQQGYAGTSLDDLLAAMRLSKSSFYQAFKSKHALFVKSIRHYLILTSNQFNADLEIANTGRQFIVEIFENVVKDDEQKVRGCMVSNTATEFGQSDIQVSKIIKKGLNIYKDIFKRAIVKGQNDGSINKNLDSEQLAGFLVVNLNGLRTMVKAGTDKNALRGMVGIVITTID